MTTYIINLTDPAATRPTFTISATVTDGPGNTHHRTSLSLHGFGADVYGENMNENFVHLLENFACTEDSTNLGNPDPLLLSAPYLRGQLWFNNSTNTLMVFDGEYDLLNVSLGFSGRGWSVQGGNFGTTVSNAEPINQRAGDIWYNTVATQLMVFDGSAWKSVADRYYTKVELDNGQLDNRYYTETELDAGQLDNRYYTETEMDTKLDARDELSELTDVVIAGPADNEMLSYDFAIGKWINQTAGQIGVVTTTTFNAHSTDPDIHFTETSINHGSIGGLSLDDHPHYLNQPRGDERYYTQTELDSGQLDNKYYTETELDDGQLDNRYYTESELIAGALDTRYYTESEVTDLISGSIGLTDTGHIYGTNGYQKLSNGLIMQWGTTAYTGNGGTITTYFPLVFPNRCLQVVSAQNYANTGSANGNTTSTHTFNRSYFRATASDNSTTIHYFAIGY